jgi:hypothetical protein
MLKKWFVVSVPLMILGVLSAAQNSAHAQVPIPIPTAIPTAIPTGLPIPIPPGIPTSLPAPGGTLGIPSIPGLPSMGQGLFSPTGALTLDWMKKEAARIFDKMKAGLSATNRAKVDSVPLKFNPVRDDVNAFAGCDDGGTYVVVTEGMYDIIDLIAQAKATDETFSTSYYADYIKMLASQQAGAAKVLPLPPGALDVTKSLNPNKLKRQYQLFEEITSFVLGHELGHHYEGHLSTSCSGTKAGDFNAFLSKYVPMANQPFEIDADRVGTNNVLDAGQNESDYKWSEKGSLLLVDFFLQLRDTAGPGAVVFGFMSTHPAPEVRNKTITATAGVWRLLHPGATTG